MSDYFIPTSITVARAIFTTFCPSPTNGFAGYVVNLYLAWDLSCDEALLRYVAVGQ